MATIETVGVAVTMSTAALTRGIASARAQMAAFGRSINSMGASAMKSVSGLAPIAAGAGLAIGAGILAGAGWGVKLAAEAEQAKVSFTVMLGSIGQANTMIADLKKAAASTPFEFTDLQQGAKSLLAFGIEANKVLPTLNALGDVSGGDAQKMQSLAVVFGQISSTGKLMGQDLLQLINVGFNPLQEISKKTGKSVSVLKKEMEQGKISFKMVEDAFKSATGEGGRFHGMMSLQSKTMVGMWSSFTDSVASQLTKVGETLIAAFDMKGSIGNIGSFVDQAGAAFDSMTPYIMQFGNVVRAGFDMLKGVGGEVLVYWQDLFASWGLTANSFGAGVQSVLIDLEFAFTNWRDILGLTFDQNQLDAAKFTNDLTFFFTDTIPSVLDAFANNWQTIFRSVFDQTVANWKEMITALGEMRMPVPDFTPLATGLSEAFKDVATSREATSFEKNLQAQIDQKTDSMGKKYLELEAKRKKEFIANSKPKAEVREALAGAAGFPALDALKTQFGAFGGLLGKLKFEMPKGEAYGATGALRKGSKEARSALLAHNRGKSPEQQAVDELKQVKKFMGQLVQQGRAVAENPFKVVTSLFGT